jgi:hypothetical protein
MAFGSEDDIVTAFLNATMAGTLSNDQGADTACRCLELGEPMTSNVAICQAQERDTVGRRPSKAVAVRPILAFP